MHTLIIVAVAIVVSVVFAVVARRRRGDAPSQPVHHKAPAQLDRADFVQPDTPWLVAVFTSATCDTCAGVLERASILESSEVAVTEVEVSRDGDLHDRYRITGVPIVAIADRDGVVVASFVGPVSSTHLWGAMAEVRDPGSVPSECGASGDAEDAEADGPTIS